MIGFGGKIIWLGHATMKIITPKGKVILIDPWTYGNPACPDNLKDPGKVDIMLITHGHFDHIGDAVQVAKKYNPKVIAVYETCEWLSKKGVSNTMPMNKGGTQVIDDIKITMVSADHSCGILDPDTGNIVYGGDPVGYVVELENGFKFYHAGDTNVFEGMRLIRELYAPKLAMLPIGDLFTMSPYEAAKACELLMPKYVLPMHFGTFPLLTGTPAKLKDLIRELPITIIETKPGSEID